MSADQAHVELETEHGPTAAQAAVFFVTNHLNPQKNKHGFELINIKEDFLQSCRKNEMVGFV